MGRPNWTYQASIYLPTAHCMLYRDDTLGVQLQIVTRQRSLMPAGKVREYYFIDGVQKVFRSEESLVRALRRKVTGRWHEHDAEAWRRVAYGIQAS